MRSRANLKSHPIHVMLIPFPLAFLFGAFFFDAAGAALDQPALWQTGRHLALAGIATALLAAVPGFIDYLYSVPPESTGKARATKHLSVNLTAVVLFALATWLRGGVEAPPIGVLGLELVGVALLTVGGWLGGTLVYRNQIGVDHRYAGAGKWNEASVEEGDGPVVVARADELEVNQMKLLRADDRRIVLARTEDGWFAFDDRCTHRGGPLADGALICGTVQCPWHGSQFDVRSGKVEAGPAEEPIGTYAVEERDGEILLDVRRRAAAEAD